jgi:hypothetical protein
MKEATYYFDKLSELEREQFIENFDLRKDVKSVNQWISESKYKSFSAFLGCSFIWSETEQGHKYWYRISKREIE